MTEEIFPNLPSPGLDMSRQLNLDMSRRFNESLKRALDPEEKKFPLSEVRSTVFELRRLPEYRSQSWRELAREAIRVLEEIEIENHQYGQAKVYSEKRGNDFSGPLSRFSQPEHTRLIDLTKRVTGYGKKQYVDRILLFLKEELKVADLPYIHKHGVPFPIVYRVLSSYKSWSKAKLGKQKSKNVKTVNRTYQEKGKRSKSLGSLKKDAKNLS
jgi:hypothetical protein